MEHRCEFSYMMNNNCGRQIIQCKGNKRDICCHEYCLRKTIKHDKKECINCTLKVPCFNNLINKCPNGHNWGSMKPMDRWNHSNYYSSVISCKGIDCYCVSKIRRYDSEFDKYFTYYSLINSMSGESVDFKLSCL